MSTRRALILIFCGCLACSSITCDDGAPARNNGNNTNNINNANNINNINNINNTNPLETPDWTEETHGKVTPDYDQVFPQDSVQRLELIVDPEQWAILQDDLADHLSDAHNGPGIDLGDWEPVFVPCTVRYGGREWYQVGLRVKGNSSLVATYSLRIEKYSFKLDFDEFEDTWPQIRDQRFFGFKQLNLNNGFDDRSVLRERLATGLFREFGLVAAHTATAAVTVDFGEGPVYHGVYTLVEEVDDTVITRKFPTGGNLYKPDGRAATFGAGTFVTAELVKKTNEELADFSDVRALYDALHAPSRTVDAAAWRAGLEAVFDVDTFLRWLAANTVIQNWDSYGLMWHNYYLYHDPATARLTWIPWDHNEAFTDGKDRGVLSLGLDEVTAQWPLIRYLLDDPTYLAAYEESMRSFATEVFTPERMLEQYDSLAALVREDAEAELWPYTFLRSPADFDAAMDTLRTHVQTRQALVLDHLGL